jgi:putative heme iron utilization protein
MTQRKIDPIRPTDDEARELARGLLEKARYAAIGVVEPQTGFPLVSRIAFGRDSQGRPVFLASELSFHSRALGLDQRASMLVGEPPAKGDPLAFPRITLIGKVEKIDRGSPQRDALRGPWLEQHPKAQLYIDFGDFHFFRMDVERAHLNGGFGKAFVLNAADLGIAS